MQLMLPDVVCTKVATSDYTSVEYFRSLTFSSTKNLYPTHILC